MENIYSSPEELKMERARRKVRSLKRFYKHLTVYLIINIALLVVKAANLEPGEDFVSWNTFNTAFWWGIGLLFHAFGVFGPDVFLGNGWEERKIKEYMDRHPEGGPTKWE